MDNLQIECFADHRPLGYRAPVSSNVIISLERVINSMSLTYIVELYKVIVTKVPHVDPRAMRL